MIHLVTEQQYRVCESTRRMYSIHLVQHMGFCENYVKLMPSSTTLMSRASILGKSCRTVSKSLDVSLTDTSYSRGLGAGLF